MKTKLYSMFKAATLTVLLLAGNMAKATDITPGYYYMKGTEVSSAKGLYLRTTSADLPHMIAHEMPATPTMDEKPYIWKVEALNDGNFSIQNITDGYYLGGQEGNFAHHGSLAATPHAIKFTYFDTFNNGSAEVSGAWKLDAQTDRDTNYGSALRPGQGGEYLILWYCDSQGGDAPVWYFEPVDATIAQQLEQNPGTYDGADVEEGYYLVRANAGNSSKPGAYLYANADDKNRTYQNTSAGELNPEEVTDEMLPYIYHVKKTATGYTFQNMLNGRYIGGSPNTNGHHVGAVSHPAAMVLKYYEEKNAYSIEDKEQPSNGFLPALLNSGNEAFAWWAGSADWLLPNIYWDLVKVNYTVGKIDISAQGMATYYNNKSYTMPEGLRGATVSLYGTEANGYVLYLDWKYAAGDAVPAGEALVVEGQAGTYPLQPAETDKAATAGNLLQGYFTEGTDAEAGKFFTAYNDGKTNLFYKLTTKDGKDLGFYWGAADGAAFYMSSSNHAYLVVEKTVAQKVKSFTLDGTATGIEKMQTTTGEANVIYNLAGQRTTKALKGIYIVNGKKVLK